MKFKVNCLVFVLFILIMFSLGSVTASENVSDDLSNNDLISFPAYSTFEVDDNVGIQNAVNELSLELNDNNTHSSDDVLKLTNNFPLKAESSGTFNDIQKAIDSTVAGGTVFLNGTNYSGNKQITINKNIVIDGASESDGNMVSILDANSASRIL